MTARKRLLRTLSPTCWQQCRNATEAPLSFHTGAWADRLSAKRSDVAADADRPRSDESAAGSLVALAFILTLGILPSANASDSYGLASRTPSMPYLRMPHNSAGTMPKLLSETGAFKNAAQFEPAEGLIPYDLAVPFWSDGASKTRWVAIPKEKVHFTETGEWTFPSGTVFVKTFELPVDDTNPSKKRRLETRLIVRDDRDAVYGVTYKWRANNEDADLLETNLTESIPIRTPTGVRTQMWSYPSRADCLTCHTRLNSGVLGVKTRQLNCEITYPSGVKDNQLRAWNHLVLFDERLDEATLSQLPSLAKSSDQSRSIEDRARSYLDANCAHCHRPGGTVAYFDARYDTPLPEQSLINGRVLIDERIDNARIIAPNDIWRSILYMRLNTVEAFKMPPLAHNMADQSGIKLIGEWIGSLPGSAVLAPPEILPRGGKFKAAPEITIKAAPGSEIHYTLDGTVPTKSDPVYTKPLHPTGPVIVRAKAFQPGHTKSITSQEIYIVGN